MRNMVARAKPDEIVARSPAWESLLGDPQFEHYRGAEQIARVESLLSLLPRGRRSVLDIGARDGFLSAILTDFFDSVTALDLSRPTFQFDRVTTVKGDASQLEFSDNSFDVVFCAEVLEHVPALEPACREIARVARHEVLIGVPNRQDTRVGRTSCAQCGAINPPYGHINTFTAERLRSLFAGLQPIQEQRVGSMALVTNGLATQLRYLAGNPYGTYEQQEPCVCCGARLVAPSRTVLTRAYSRVAASLDALQRPFVRPEPYWLHMLFAKS